LLTLLSSLPELITFFSHGYNKDEKQLATEKGAREKRSAQEDANEAIDGGMLSHNI
jgi:hypothetical protein